MKRLITKEMKNLITIIALLFTTGLFAQKQDSTIQPISVPIQFGVEDTVNHKTYSIILAQMKDTEYIFQYAEDWNVNKAEVNRKFAAYKPLVQTYELVSPGTWRFTIIEGLIDPNEVFQDFVSVIMYPYMEQMGRTLNKKVDKKK